MRIEIETKFRARVTSWHIRKILRCFNRVDLEGIESVRVLDTEPNDPEAGKQPSYLVGFLYCGRYQKGKNGKGATIFLYTRDLYFGIPALFAISPMARLNIASTVAHEVGHHLAASGKCTETRMPKVKLNSLIDSESERRATAYAEQVVDSLLGSRYFRIGKKMLRFFSSRSFKAGSDAHWRGDYKSAAELEFRAYMLSTDNTEAWQAYLQDRQLMLEKTPSALSDSERLWIYHRRSVGSSA